MNTCFEYLYRDASNYKSWNAAIVSGEITTEQIQRIMDCMDGEYFVPRSVGLPEYRITPYRTDDDGPYFELWIDEKDGIAAPLDEQSFIRLTEIEPTENITVEELVGRFEGAKGNWDLTSWEEDYEYYTYEELYGDD